MLINLIKTDPRPGSKIIWLSKSYSPKIQLVAARMG